MLVLRFIGYVAFFIFALILALYFTFPYEIAKDRLLREASKQSDMTITARSLTPSWFTGAVLKDVTIVRPGVDKPIELPRVQARVHVLALLTGQQGVTLDLPIAQGNASGDVVQTEDGTDVIAQVSGVEVALLPGFVDATGVPMTGTLDLDVDLFAGNDPKKSEGVIKIRTSGLTILEGPVYNFPVPELSIGGFDWTIPISNGKALLEKLQWKGESFELKVDGNITLGKPLSRSTVSLALKVKPTPALLNKVKELGFLLNTMKRTQSADGFYGFRVSGRLASPRIVPKKL